MTRKTKGKPPLKRSKSGLELESQVLNKKGYPVNKASFLIKECKKVKKDIPLVKECAKHMIELNSFPSVKVQNVALDLIRNFKIVLEVAKQNDLTIYPLSTYLGRFTPTMRTKKWYEMQEKILGKEKFIMGGKGEGFNYHYTLPRGVFDEKTKFLKPLLSSKVKQTLIDSYNLAVAMDPALITFLQSSPFLDGEYLAKDSKVLLYRGGQTLNYPKGLYTGFQQYGALPAYKQTLTDLIYSLKSRHKRMKRIFENEGVPAADISKYGKVLDFCWGPVRINKLGTLEQRSMDTNFLSNVIALSVLMKYAQRKVHQDGMRVVPSEVGLEEPFKVEGNTVYVAPHTHVRKRLQRLSAYKGFEDKEVFNYCKRFFKFAEAHTHQRYSKVVEPLKQMLKEKKSVSDMLIKEVRKAGYNLDERISDEFLAELALRMCEKQVDEMDGLEDLVKNLD